MTHNNHDLLEPTCMTAPPSLIHVNVELFRGGYQYSGNRIKVPHKVSEKQEEERRCDLATKRIRIKNE